MRIEHLPLRTRRLIGAAGAELVTQTVHCPIRNASVPVEECEACMRLVTRDERRVTCRTLPVTLDAAAARLRALVPRAAEETPLHLVMRRDVACVTPGAPLAVVRRDLLAGRCDAVPVVDDQGYPLGMITKTDLLRTPGAHVAGEVMTPLALTLEETASLADAAALMNTERVSHLSIVAHDGTVVGLLSSEALVRWLRGEVG